jgi:hypothetical protein
MKKLAVLLALFFLFPPGVVQAQSASVTANNNVAELNFPNSITFKADLASSTTIVKVKLHYGTYQDTCGNVSSIAFPEITTGLKVSAKWEWDMRQSGGEPPGAVIWWQWEVVDSDGNSAMTEIKELTWIDSVHNWQQIDKGLIRLHYYDNDAAYGQTLADTADEALNRLSQDIGIAPEEPIDLYIYETTDDMRDAVFYEPGWTGGLAYSDYNILIIGIEPYNLEWGKSTEAHELTHILAGDYTFSCFGSTPTWLSEGLAVYGEGGPGAVWADLFQQNINDDTLLSFKVLSGGFSEDPDVADLSYSQSYYMVNYLIENYDQQKMLDFLSALRSGGGLDESLLAGYGFDLAGFENEWRVSLGLSPVSTGEAIATPVPTIIPTIVPIQGAQSQAFSQPDPTATAAVTATPERIPTFPNDETVVEPAQTTFVQQLLAKYGFFLPWILGIMVVILVLLVAIILIATRKKGDQ